MGLVDNQTAKEYTNYMFKSCLKEDPVMFRYLKENESVSSEKLESFHNFFTKLKNRKMVVEIVKSFIKNTLCNLKNTVLAERQRNGDEEQRSKMMIKFQGLMIPVFQFIQPENIDVHLSEDEYIALINDMSKKNKEYKPVNLYVLIATNMCMNLVSSNLKTLLGNKLTDNGDILAPTDNLSDEAIDELYKKVIVSNEELSSEDKMEASPNPEDIICISSPPKLIRKRRRKQEHPVKNKKVCRQLFHKNMKDKNVKDKTVESDRESISTESQQGDVVFEDTLESNEENQEREEEEEEEEDEKEVTPETQEIFNLSEDESNKDFFDIGTVYEEVEKEPVVHPNSPDDAVPDADSTPSSPAADRENVSPDVSVKEVTKDAPDAKYEESDVGGEGVELLTPAESDMLHRRTPTFQQMLAQFNTKPTQQFHGARNKSLSFE